MTGSAPESTPSYFRCLLGAEYLALDPEALTRAYHAKSLAVHPDRAESPEARRQAVDEMALLNRAYQTLRDPFARARYFLDTQGVAHAAGGVPALAGDYFELQELAAERPAGDAEVMAGYRTLSAALQGMLATQGETLARLFERWDAARPDDVAERDAVIQAIAQLLRDRRYAVSMQTDLRKRFEEP